MRIQIEVAPGELIDRVTILEIKLAKITDSDKLANIKNEFDTLTESVSRMREWIDGNRQHRVLKDLDKLALKLRETNEQIWDIEDRIRDLERDQDFGEEFIEVARSVYYTNDKRAALKKEISMLFDSDIAEEKSYAEYQCPG